MNWKLNRDYYKLFKCFLENYDHDRKFIGLSSTKSTSTSPSYALSTATQARQKEFDPLASEDFSPCNHSYNTVLCDHISLREVESVFNQTYSPTLESVKLTLKPYIFSETFVPEEIFGTKKIQGISIGYSYGVFINRSLSLQVDVDAFRSTKNFTIYYADCSVLNLGFLSGFDELTSLKFSNMNNIGHCCEILQSCCIFFNFQCTS